MVRHHTHRLLRDPGAQLNLLLALVPLGWAFILMLDGPTLHLSPAYDVMERLATETQWASFSLLVAMIAFWCDVQGSRGAMVIAKMVLLFWHGMVALCIWLAAPLSTGTMTYAALALVATIRLLGLASSYAARRQES